MIKLKNANVMHFDPNEDIIKSYKLELDLEADKNKQKAQDKIVDDEDEDEMNGETCGICYKNKVNSVFLPCKHCEICSECSLKTTYATGLCPFCRTVNIFNILDQRSSFLKKKFLGLEFFILKLLLPYHQI